MKEYYLKEESIWFIVFKIEDNLDYTDDRLDQTCAKTASTAVICAPMSPAVK